MKSSTKKKRGSDRKASPNADSIRVGEQVVKVKSVKKASEPKQTTRLHVNAVSKSSSSSHSEQKNYKRSPLCENSNTVPRRRKATKSCHCCQVVCSSGKQKSSRQKISVKKSFVNLLETGGNHDKENRVPIEKCPQTRSSNKQRVSVQLLPVCSVSDNKQNVPCYGQNDQLIAARSGTAAKLSRKLVFQLDSAVGQQEDVYNFDEDDVPSKPGRKKGKRKKVSDSSDEEYFPSKKKVTCKLHESVLPKAIDMNCFNIHSKKNTNPDNESIVDNLLPEELHSEIDGRTEQMLSCDQESSNADGNNLQRCTSNISNDKKLSLKPVVSLKRLSFPTCETEFSLSDVISISENATKLKSNEIENNSLLVRQSASDISYLSPKSYVERSCVINDMPVFKIGTLTNKRLADICNDQPYNFKGFMSSQCTCTPDRKLSYVCTCHNNVEILHTEREKMPESSSFVHPSSTSINKCASSKKTLLKNAALSDPSNKENIPTFMQQSPSKSRRRSRKLWRPTAYVSPKAYTERNFSLEDSFDSSPRIKTGSLVSNGISENSSSKCVPSIQDSKLCDSPCLGILGNVTFNEHSGCITDSGRLSKCQVMDAATSKSSTQSECATPDQLKTSTERDVCVATPIAHKVTVQTEKRVPTLQGSGVASSESTSNVTGTVICNKDTMARSLLSDSRSISVCSDRDVSFANRNLRRIEIRASRGMCRNDAGADQVGECNTSNYFGFDQEEPEEELLSPIKMSSAQVSHLNIATSSTPDHGTSTTEQAVKPWRSILSRVTARPARKKQATLHSFLSKSAPQPQLKQDESAVVVPEVETNSSLHTLQTCSAQAVTTAVSTPALFSVDEELYDHDPSSRRQPARVYSHPRKGKKFTLASLQEEQVPVTEDKGENVSRKTAKKRSKKEAAADSKVEKFLSEINNQFEEIENFELCVE